MPLRRLALKAGIAAGCLGIVGRGSVAAAGDLVTLPSRPAAPEIALPDLSGLVHRLSGMRGQVVLLNFWASWCAPCRAEIPSLERLHQRGGRFAPRIVAVNLGEDRAAVESFVRGLSPKPTFDILIDREGRARESWPLRGLPTTFVLDPDGRVSHVSQGARHWDGAEVRALVNALQQTNRSGRS